MPKRRVSAQGAYHAGRRFEWRVRDRLEQAGWTVWRVAGSRTPVDLVALRAGAPPVLVQARRAGRIDPADRAALGDLAQRVGGLPVVATPGDPPLGIAWTVIVMPTAPLRTGGRRWVP